MTFDTTNMNDALRALRAALAPFWDSCASTLGEPNMDGDRPRFLHPDAPYPCAERALCVHTSFLIEALVDGASAVSGKFRPAVPTTIYMNSEFGEDHSMVHFPEHGFCLDLTIGQFADEPLAAVFDVDDPEIDVQESSRISMARASEDAKFITLLRRPNPIGREPTVARWIRENPEQCEAIREACHTLLEAIHEKRAEPNMEYAG